jgi:sugar lactone lactonase YvrE
MDMSVEVERVGGVRAILGEGPVWDVRDKVLWWLDIPGENLHRHNPATGADDTWALGRQVGALVPRESGGIVLATPEGFVAFDPATAAETVLASVEADDADTRMNDGKCDRAGRFYAGTMAYDYKTGVGSFYRLDPDGTVTKLFGGTSISNGLAWSADDSTLFYIDSPTGSVDAFDFDASSGTLANRRPVAKIDEALPDGMCIDDESFLWVALYGGGAVHRYSPDGTLDGVLEVPARNVTCCAFGGDDWGDLYITTARGDEDDPAGGALYRCRPGVTGPPVNVFTG